MLSGASLSVTAYEGTTALLPCDAAGTPKPKIKWYFGKKRLPGGDARFVVLGNGALQISDVRNSDAGKYKCTATNDVGTDEQTAELTVRPADECKKKENQWDSTGK